jgi:hypothetical protein
VILWNPRLDVGTFETRHYAVPLVRVKVSESRELGGEYGIHDYRVSVRR